MLKLLITGGLGFIGSNLVDSLSKKNHKIKILTKTFSKKNNIKNSYDKVEIEKINLLYLSDNSLGEESLLVVIHYLEQRLNNAHTLKFIIFAKMNNLTEEEIYKILEK